MSLTEDEILEILKLVDESDFDELHLEMPGLKLTVGKGANTLHTRSSISTASEPSLLTPHKEEMETESSSTDVSGFGSLADNHSEPAPLSSPPQVSLVSLDEEGLLPIKSPVLGIFYLSPKPGAPPFVEVGKHVNDDDTVCIIEVMKLFNAVKAGVKGRIAKICAKNNEMVEYQQTLFLVEPVKEDSGASEDT